MTQMNRDQMDDLERLITEEFPDTVEEESDDFSIPEPGEDVELDDEEERRFFGSDDVSSLAGGV